MGKSTAMKHIAISWADGTSEDLKKFQLVFHISLKHVKDNSPMENIIIAQHSGLKANKVNPDEVKSILGDTDNILLLIDGHDEYKTGCNSDVDAALRKEHLWNCWMILTSRETEQIKEIKEYMDAEAEILGFDESKVEEYISKFLENADKTKMLLSQAHQNNLCLYNKDYGYFFGFSLMKIPILLHMICMLFACNLALPSSQTGILQAIVDRCIDREAIRAKGQKAVDKTKQALFKLGNLAWQGLNKPGKKLIFEKVKSAFFAKN